MIDYGEVEATGERPSTTMARCRLLDHALARHRSPPSSRRRPLGRAVTYRLYQERDRTAAAAVHERIGRHHARDLDVGVQYHPDAVAVPSRSAPPSSHLGPALQVINAEQADPDARARMRAGAAYELMHHFAVGHDDRRCGRRPDVAGSWRDGVANRHSGHGSLELILDRTIFVRGGHAPPAPVSTAGPSGRASGLRYDRFDVGIAKAFAVGCATGGQDPYHITFAIGF
jgi:hypothetical protein